MRTPIPTSAVPDALKTSKVWAVSDGRTKEFEVKNFSEGPFVVIGENGIGLPNTLSLRRMSEDLGFTFEKEESPKDSRSADKPSAITPSPTSEADCDAVVSFVARPIATAPKDREIMIRDKYVGWLRVQWDEATNQWEHWFPQDVAPSGLWAELADMVPNLQPGSSLTEPRPACTKQEDSQASRIRELEEALKQLVETCEENSAIELWFRQLKHESGVLDAAKSALSTTATSEHKATVSEGGKG